MGKTVDREKLGALYRARGSMTRTEFLLKHGVSENALRKAMASKAQPPRPAQKKGRQLKLPFVGESEDREPTLAEVLAENDRLHKLVNVLLRALWAVRDKADDAIDHELHQSGPKE